VTESRNETDNLALQPAPSTSPLQFRAIKRSTSGRKIWYRPEKEDAIDGIAGTSPLISGTLIPATSRSVQTSFV